MVSLTHEFYDMRDDKYGLTENEFLEMFLNQFKEDYDPSTLTTSKVIEECTTYNCG